MARPLGDGPRSLVRPGATNGPHVRPVLAVWLHDKVHSGVRWSGPH